MRVFSLLTVILLKKKKSRAFPVISYKVEKRLWVTFLLLKLTKNPFVFLMDHCLRESKLSIGMREIPIGKLAHRLLTD